MKPQCRSIQHCFSDYIDRALSARQSENVAAHLRACCMCQQEFDSLRRTTGLLNYYVEPECPDGYHERFWREFQCRIEQADSASAWSGVDGLCQSVQDFFKRMSYLFDTLSAGCSSVVPVWRRLVPLSMMILGIFVAFQVIYLPEKREWTVEDQLQSPLKASSVQLVKTPNNRELVARRDRVILLPQVLFQKDGYGLRKESYRFGTIEVARQDARQEWGNFSRFSFADNREMIRELAAEGDVFRDMLAFAQLSVPGSALPSHDFSGLVGINSPFPDKFEREGPQLNSFVGVLENVAVRDLSLAEVYDSVKL